GDDAATLGHRGILIKGAVSSMGSGLLTVLATGGLGTSANEGFFLDGAASQVITVDGDVRITAIAGDASSAIAFNSGSVASTGVGNIALIADSMNLLTGSITAGSSTVALRQKQDGTAIDLGGADSAGVLGLTDGELDTISAGTISVGDANTGNVTVSAAITRAAATDLNVTSGAVKKIAFNSGSLDAHGGNVTLTAGGA